MKANELMIGDWIDVRGIYVRVSKLDDMDNFKGRYGCAELQLTSDTLLTDCVNPIPLTEEILKANGFIHINIDDDYGYSHSMHPKDEKYLNWLLNRTNRINYVHELQHALRLCGLNELADNFKID